MPYVITRLACRKNIPRVAGLATDGDTTDDNAHDAGQLQCMTNLTTAVMSATRKKIGSLRNG
jgi:hypothetical protein